jgi:hypothetical protein
MLSGRASTFDEAETFLAAARSTDDYTLAAALAYLAVMNYVAGNIERSLQFAEEAARLANQTGNPTLMANADQYLGGALEDIDPARARSVLETALDYGNVVGLTNVVVACIAWLGRMGVAVLTDPERATQLRNGLTIPYEAGDTRTTLYHLDIYAQAVAATDRAEPAALLTAAIAKLSAHVSNPISIAHRRLTDERLLNRLGADRLAELTAQGAALTYDQTVALALSEIDRAITAETQSESLGTA